MSPGPTFERVYAALKEQLASGRFVPGEHLEPTALGEELYASITPVRDALHRLVGERIVEAPRNDGFRVPAPMEAELRDLYGWNQTLLGLALRGSTPRGRAAALRTGDHGGEAVETEADLFRAIARRTGNAEHEAAVENLSDRLASLRIAEARLFGDETAEFDALRSAWKAGDLAEVRRRIAAYHRRRQRCAPEILILSRDPHRER